MARFDLLAVAIASSLLVAVPVSAETYRFVETDGTVHFTNTPTDPQYQRMGFTSGTERGWLQLPLPDLAPYAREIREAAGRYGVEERLIKAVIRVESGFNSRAVSPKGARGLMQLMPGTARWVAKQLARSDFSSAQITQVDLNTQFGAYYFKYWHDRLDRMPALAAAAYNAGPGRAQAWRPAVAPLEGAIWVETIPFNETRDYVKKVLANAMLYTRALNRPYVSLSTRLGTIPPRTASTGALAAQTE